MRTKLVLAAVCALATAGAASSGRAPAARLTTEPRRAGDAAQTAPRFVENAGQWGGGVSFLAVGRERTVALGPSSMTLVQTSGARRVAVEYAFEGAGGGRPCGESPTRVMQHYFHGSATARHARTFSSVAYEDVWPGVALRFDAKPSAVEYSLVVAPGADAEAARFRVTGAERVATTASGALAVTSAAGTVTHSRPVAWQEIDGQRRDVDVAFDVGPRGEDGAYSYGFALGEHDASRAVVVDPTFDVVSLPTGLQSGDALNSIALDGDGNVFAGGQSSWSGAVPAGKAGFDAAIGGSFDAWLGKFDPQGELLWATFLGGSESDSIGEVALSPAGDAFVVGYGSPADFPRVGGPLGGSSHGQFVARISADGAQLVHSDLIGSTSAHVAFGPAGEPWIAFASTDSMDTLPPPTSTIGLLEGDVLAWVGRISPAGGFDSLAELHGTSKSQSRYVTSLAVGGDGAAYLAGAVSGPGGLPPAVRMNSYNGGYSDAYVLKLQPAGVTLDYALHIGGSAYDTAAGIVVDAAGAAYVVGETQSSLTTFPRVVSEDTETTVESPGAAFLTKISPVGDAVHFTLALGGWQWGGGNGAERYYGLAFDGAGRVIVSAYLAQMYRVGTSGGPAETYGDFNPALRPAIRSASEFWLAYGSDLSLRRVRDISATIPSHAAAVPLSPRIVRFSWIPAGGDETSFVVQRATATGPFFTIATPGADATFLEDTGLDPDTTYRYRVIAVTPTATSEPTVPVEARTLPTVKVRVQRAKVLDRSGANGDSIALSAMVRFFASQSDGTFDPANDRVRLTIDGVFGLDIPAGDAGWTPKGSGYVWTGTLGAQGTARLRIDFTRKRMSLRVSGINLLSTPTAGTEVTLRAGNDAGSHEPRWSVSRRASVGLR